MVLCFMYLLFNFFSGWLYVIRLFQEERHRTKEKNDSVDTNPTSSAVSDMPVSRIREAELLVQPTEDETAVVESAEVSNLTLSILYLVFIKCRPPSLIELNPMIYNTGLTHLGSEASKSSNNFCQKLEKLCIPLIT